MKVPFPREGIIAALAIPTDAHGRVMKRALAAHIGWMRTHGIHGVLALSSTGEFPHFSIEERKAVLELVAELAAPLPVIANISDIRPSVAAELGKFARRLKLPGVALMPPGMYPVSDADQLAYFAKVAEATQLPAMLYNFPELMRNRIAPETIAAFAQRAPLAAIKQSGAEITYHKTLIQLGREFDFEVFTGADTRLPELFSMGVAGCVGGLANFVPDLMVGIFQRCRQNTRVHPAAAQMKEIGAIIDRLHFPRNIAAGIEARGLEPGLPKSIVSAESTKIYRGVVAELRVRFKKWKLAPAVP